MLGAGQRGRQDDEEAQFARPDWSSAAPCYTSRPQHSSVAAPAWAKRLRIGKVAHMDDGPTARWQADGGIAAGRQHPPQGWPIAGIAQLGTVGAQDITPQQLLVLRLNWGAPRPAWPALGASWLRSGRFLARQNGWRKQIRGRIAGSP